MALQSSFYGGFYYSPSRWHTIRTRLTGNLEVVSVFPTFFWVQNTSSLVIATHRVVSLSGLPAVLIFEIDIIELSICYFSASAGCNLMPKPDNEPRRFVKK